MCLYFWVFWSNTFFPSISLSYILNTKPEMSPIYTVLYWIYLALSLICLHNSSLNLIWPSGVLFFSFSHKAGFTSVQRVGNGSDYRMLWVGSTNHIHTIPDWHLTRTSLMLLHSFRILNFVDNEETNYLTCLLLPKVTQHLLLVH